MILGGNGMLGHQLLKQLSPKHEIRVTLREGLEAYAHFGLFDITNAYSGVDVRNIEDLAEVFADYSPQAVVNAVGLVKQRAIAKESIPSLEINSLLPHRLCLLCKMIEAKLIHLSTDCIFSGQKGHYQENDVSDAVDLYGRSKYLGEVHAVNCLTLRTSIIGPEISRKKGLFEWLLAQRGAVKGFTKAIYTGFTTIEMSRIIEYLLMHYPDASGMYHVSSEPIDKYRLLVMIRDRFDLDVEINPDGTFVCDRSLDSTEFRKRFRYTPPSWETMLDELYLELTRSCLSRKDIRDEVQ